jgi:FixJ family two-component response regulator
MGLIDSQESVGLSSRALSLPQVSLLLFDQALCNQLQTALGEFSLAVNAYSSESVLFAARPPEQIDCLVLSTDGGERVDIGLSGEICARGLKGTVQHGQQTGPYKKNRYTSGNNDQDLDGVRLLEKLQAAALYVPTVMIVTDPRVRHAVRAMRALAVECFDHHTPIPLLARSIRNVAQCVSAQRETLE